MNQRGRQATQEKTRPDRARETIENKRVNLRKNERTAPSRAEARMNAVDQDHNT